MSASARQSVTITFDGSNKSASLPLLEGTIGPSVADIRKLYGDLGIFTANQFQQTTFAGFNNETAVPIVPALSSGLYPNGLAINGYANQFHNAYMNDPQSCIFCHTTSGQTDGWNYNIKNWVHGIHSSGFRNNPYTAHNTSQFWRIKYPAILNNCEACHVPGSYDFSNSTNANQIPSMLWDTEASGTVSAALQAAPAPGPAQYTLPQVTAPAKAYAAPFVTPGSTYGTSFGGAWALPLTASQTYTNTPAAAGTLVTSPLTAACSGCHDSPTAIYHMAGGIGGTVGGGVGGGVFYGPRPAVGTVPANTESCLVCHGQGTIADIYTVHLNFAGANPVN
jgi:OmcA/MtrC family decaheme c-type cytochrome